ncbi:MAG: YARHG domain-containing protein [Cyclobacteriaceae bacterium]
MKIRTFLFSMSVLLGVFNSVHGQGLIFSKEYRLIGNYDEMPLFKLYDQNKPDPYGVYSVKEFNGLYGFNLFKEYPVQSEGIKFILGEVFIEGSGLTRNDYTISIYRREKLLLSLKAYGVNYAYSHTENALIIFTKNDGWEGLVYIDLSNLTVKPLYLPLNGYRGYVVDNWLYFSYYHENDDYSPYPDDIFRVKIGDWHNPELVFTSDEYDDWFLYPESHVLVTNIELNERDLNRDNQILYNVEQESYAIIPNIRTNRSPAPAYLKYEGQFHAYFDIQDNTRGLQTIDLDLLPPLPEAYPNMDNRNILPREVWYNVPLSEKTFDETFITPYLLREAPREELGQLDKSQLRLLRNAIYAQYAYIFQSEDLQEFYNQFEWYRMMTVRKKDNDDVILLPEDETRAELIRGIELGK